MFFPVVNPAENDNTPYRSPVHYNQIEGLKTAMEGPARLRDTLMMLCILSQ